MLWSHWTNWTKTWVSQPELVDYQHDARSLEHVAAFDSTSFNLTGGGEPLRVRAAQVQPEIFAALGATPIAGRVFTPEEDQPGHEHVVMLTEGLWRTQFGSDPAIVGRTIQLDAVSYTVVGVLPAALRLPLDYASRAFTQVWVPLALGPNDPQETRQSRVERARAPETRRWRRARAGRDRHDHARISSTLSQSLRP